MARFATDRMSHQNQLIVAVDTEKNDRGEKREEKSS